MNNVIWYYNPHMQKYYYTNYIPHVVQQPINIIKNTNNEHAIDMVVDHVNEITQTEHDNEPAIIQINEITDIESNNDHSDGQVIIQINEITQTESFNEHKDKLTYNEKYDFDEIINITQTETIYFVENYMPLNDNNDNNEIVNNTIILNKYYNTLDICLSVIFIIILIL